LVRIREDLGDALFASTEYALAAAAYARAMENVNADQAPVSLFVNAKLLDAYLHVPAHDKALAVAAAASPAMAGSMAERLYTYVQDLAKIDGQAATECIDRFKAGAPHLFKGEWAGKFDQVRRSASQPVGTSPAK
jgi:hypothetical protein